MSAPSITRRSLAASLFSGVRLVGAEDRKELLARATTFDSENYAALRAYVWNSEEISFRNGIERRQQKYEINMLSGGMYWRKIEQDRQPLSGPQAEQEKKRLEKHLNAPRQLDGLPAEDSWSKERAFLELLPRLHRITRFQQASWRSIPTFHLRLTPGPQSSPLHPLADFAQSFEINVDLERASLHWVRAEWKALRSVKWQLRQLPLGRLSMLYSSGIVFTGAVRKGHRLGWSLERLPSGPWALQEFYSDGGEYANRLRYFNYRRFASESELILR